MTSFTVLSSFELLNVAEDLQRLSEQWNKTKLTRTICRLLIDALLRVTPVLIGHQVMFSNTLET